MDRELKISYRYFNSKEELSEEEQLLFDKALQARNDAYAPYSHFNVGCAVLLEGGEIITANNQENAAYPSGLCAERSAIFWTAGNYPGKKIIKMLVIGAPADGSSGNPATPPCGACRQSILEYETKQGSDIEIIFAAPDGEIFKTYAVKDLLPFTFDGSFLHQP